MCCIVNNLQKHYCKQAYCQISTLHVPEAFIPRFSLSLYPPHLREDTNPAATQGKHWLIILHSCHCSVHRVLQITLTVCPDSQISSYCILTSPFLCPQCLICLHCTHLYPISSSAYVVRYHPLFVLNLTWQAMTSVLLPSLMIQLCCLSVPPPIIDQMFWVCLFLCTSLSPSLLHSFFHHYHHMAFSLYVVSFYFPLSIFL